MDKLIIIALIAGLTLFACTAVMAFAMTKIVGRKNKSIELKLDHEELKKRLKDGSGKRIDQEM